MVKKILSSIILIMIICSTCTYATNVVVSEDTTNPSEGQETTKPDDSTTNNESGNQNTDTNTGEETGANTGTDGNKGENSDINNNTNTGTNTGAENNENANNNNQSGTNNGQTGSNVEPPKENIPQVPTTNNQGTTTNNNLITKSSEARLKELKVDVQGLTPEFDKNNTEYYLIVDLSVEQIKVTTKTVDNKATVTVLGNKNLKEGENTITINVKAEDGTIEKYYIHVTKIDDVELANAELEVLEIEGFNLYPTFKSNIYSYNLNINQNISTLDITAKPQRENAKIEIEGNEALQEGENIIKITVTAEDETTVRTYKINTYIDSDRVEIKEENKMPAIILIAVLGACIIALGISIVVKNRRK